MKFTKAVELLKEGKKVRQKEWNKGFYYVLKDFIRNQHNTIENVSICDIEAIDWEEYIEEDDWNFMETCPFHKGVYWVQDNHRKLKAKILEDSEKIPLTCRDESGRICISLEEIQKILDKRFGF